MPRLKSDERGGILLCALVILPTIFIFGAMLVDYLMLERMARTMQRAADAASLAGAYELDGLPTLQAGTTVPGTFGFGLQQEQSPPPKSPLQFVGTEDAWRRAKRAVFLALRQNDIYLAGDDLRQGPQAATVKGVPDQVEDAYEAASSPYRYTIYQFPRVEVLITRGTWWQEGSEMRFSSLETADGNLPPELMAAGFMGKNYQNANAVRVHLTLKGARPFLSAVAWGQKALPQISRSSLASPD